MSVTGSSHAGDMCAHMLVANNFHHEQHSRPRNPAVASGDLTYLCIYIHTFVCVYG